MRLIVLRICDVSFGKMKEGKQKCRILKTIRKQIAEANDIKLVTSKCRYRGDCLGTCPKCEAEVRYLEEQLLFRQNSRCFVGNVYYGDYFFIWTKGGRR